MIMVDVDSIDHGSFSDLQSKNLSQRELTLTEKLWLGEQCTVDPSALADRYNFNKNTIKKFNQSFEKGKVPKLQV